MFFCTDKWIRTINLFHMRELLYHWAISVYNVLLVGIEPTCDQLPFLQGISLRGYKSIFLVGEVGIEPTQPKHMIYSHAHLSNCGAHRI